MSTKIVLLIVVVSSAISGYLSWSLSVKEKKWPIVISSIIIGAIVSYVGTINLYMHNQFNQIESLVNSYNNELSNANHLINSLDDNNSDITKKIFGEKIEDINLKLNKIYTEKEIIIDKADILNIWTFLIEHSNQSFYATNLVPPKDWQYVNKDKFGIKPQLKAIKNKVDVKRINIFDPENSNHKNGIITVYENQKKAGIPSDTISIKNVLENYTYNSIIKELSTPDVVLVDNEILLLTIIDKNYEMQYAILCFDSNRIKSAQKFFKKLFEDFPEEKE